ncbi:hypothetical protein [Grimontia hollisae]
MANDKKNGLNAHYCNSPLEMTEKIKELSVSLCVVTNPFLPLFNAIA